MYIYSVLPSPLKGQVRWFSSNLNFTFKDVFRLLMIKFPCRFANNFLAWFTQCYQTFTWLTDNCLVTWMIVHNLLRHLTTFDCTATDQIEIYSVYTENSCSNRRMICFEVQCEIRTGIKYVSFPKSPLISKILDTETEKKQMTIISQESNFHITFWCSIRCLIPDKV